MLTEAEKEERHSLNIVIVDENLHAGEAARRALAAEGYTGVCVSPDDLFASPASSDSTTDICVPDAALFLVALHPHRGRAVEIVRWLKRCERWRGVPVVAVNDPEASQEGLQDCPADVTVADGIGEAVQSALKILLSASAPQYTDSVTVTLSLQDMLAREVSRARRTESPLSLMLARFYVPAARSALVSGDEAPGQDWLLGLRDSARRALREADTVICLDAETLLLVLPLTGKDGLSAVETRFHDGTRPVLRKHKSQSGRAVRFVAAFAQFPDDAVDWRSLFACAESRLCTQIHQQTVSESSAAA